MEYGHSKNVYIGLTVTKAQVEEFLKEDLAVAEQGVTKLVTVKLTDNQYAALVSFTFNLGAGALGSSTLLRLLNQGNYQGAADQFIRWSYAGGKQLAGLVCRRNAEKPLFLSPQDWRSRTPNIQCCLISIFPTSPSIAKLL